MQRGLIHIYCGDGKGKTTAAAGLAVRAAGCGKNILFVRFLKNAQSGEVAVLSDIAGIEMLHPEKTFGFFSTLSDNEKTDCIRVYHELWARTVARCRDGFDLLVLDECMAAIRQGLISLEEVITFLQKKPEGLEVVLTGRDPAEKLLALADYVSEIKNRKHPFMKGVAARRGIEY